MKKIKRSDIITNRIILTLIELFLFGSFARILLTWTSWSKLVIIPVSILLTILANFILFRFFIAEKDKIEALIELGIIKQRIHGRNKQSK